jgi:hypothetical protein
VRDPWFPIALMLIVLITVALGIGGPEGVTGWLKAWQTLAAAIVASIAAYIAFRNTTRSLNQAERLETNRRSRKHAALRAMLPLALAEISNYAERSARSLVELIPKCVNEALPPKIAPKDLAPDPPTNTIETLAEFIEFADGLDVSVLVSTVAWIQILDSRVRGLTADNWDVASGRLFVRTDLEGYVVDAAIIYAGAACAYEYARRRADRLPSTLSWDDVISALRNMHYWDDQHPRLYEAAQRRQKLSAGPFEKIDILNHIPRP